MQIDLFTSRQKGKISSGFQMSQFCIGITLVRFFSDPLIKGAPIKYVDYRIRKVIDMLRLNIS